jgi:hypothetical protein
LYLTQIDFFVTQLRAFLVKLLTVQIKERALQFSTPLYLPPWQKKRGVSGHINHSWRVDANWGTFEAQKKSKNATVGVMQILQK